MFSKWLAQLRGKSGSPTGPLAPEVAARVAPPYQPERFVVDLGSGHLLITPELVERDNRHAEPSLAFF